jgi:hypothetical protein
VDQPVSGLEVANLVLLGRVVVDYFGAVRGSNAG